MRRNSILTLLLLLGLTACGKPDAPTIGLYLAVQRGDLDQIDRHIQWGTDINQVIAGGQTPLHVASDRGRYVVVKLLLKHGARIDSKDQQGNTPLETSLLNGRTQIAELLVKQGAAFDADKLLDKLVGSGVEDRDVLPLVLSWGADIDHRNQDGQTPLMQAVLMGKRVLVKQLISHGADVNARDAHGTRPLDLSEQAKLDDITSILRKNGALPGNSK